MTPDGNMVSLVAQQGDCNMPATYQALMNFLFSSYIGRFMDIYLDDIVIYSNTLQEHVEHVKIFCVGRSFTLAAESSTSLHLN